jgi:hypothetical protein
MVGLPNQSTKDPRVIMKKMFYKHQQEILKTRENAAWEEFDTFNKFYERQTFYALEQAKGRGVRGKDDFCFIYYIDQRYEQKVRKFQIKRSLYVNVPKTLNLFLNNKGFIRPKTTTSTNTPTHIDNGVKMCREKVFFFFDFLTLIILPNVCRTKNKLV